MNTTPTNSPLLAMLPQLRPWSQRSDSFFSHQTEHSLELKEIHRQIKSIVVWLEMHDLAENATLLESATRSLREKWWEFEQTRRAYEPDHPRCRDALDEVLEAAGRLAGVMEDVDGRIPEPAWEGFDDV